MQKAESDVEYYRTGQWGEPDVDETARVTAKQRAREQLEVPKASWSDFARHYSKWKNLKVILGTAGSWFVLVCHI